MSRKRRQGKFKGTDQRRQAERGTLFCDEPGRKTTGAFLRSERYRRINAKRDDLSVMPDVEGNLIVTMPENAVSFAELKRRDEAELAKLGLEPGYWKH